MRQIFYYLIAIIIPITGIASENNKLASEDIAVISIDNLWLRKPSGNVKTAAIYMNISNHGLKTDYLNKVKTDVSIFTDIRKTVVIDNIAKVINIKKMAIPANSTIELKPGDIHIEILGLKKDLQVNDKINIKFYFENYGIITSEATVIESKNIRRD